MKHRSVLDVPIHQLSRVELEAEIRKILSGNSFSHVATVNPEFLVEAEKNEKFKKILQNTTLNICDGSGISIFAGILLHTQFVRIPGVEVAEMICKISAEMGKLVFFLGGFGVASNASKAMQKHFPTLRISGTLDGNMDTLEEVKSANPDVILVAFGAPKQEYWLAENGAKIPSLRLGIGVGGTFDFWAGKVHRAPFLMRKIGLEWLWRLILEPTKRAPRIWRAVFVFPWRLVKNKLKETLINGMKKERKRIE